MIEANADELIAIESGNVGKPVSIVPGEIEFAVDNLRFFGAAARNGLTQAPGEYLTGYTSFLRREPLGVAGLIAPWNYPLMMAAWKIGPALAAGNSVVLKPSELTPLTVLRLAELAGDVFPPGVFNVVTGDGEHCGAALVAHPKVAVVSLTGEVGTGKIIMKTAADSLKRVHLELGGKAPVVIFDDADIEAAVTGVRVFGYWNSGQDCTAATRVLAGPRVHDDFVAGLADAAKNLVVGDIGDESTELGPVISDEQRERVAGFVERAARGGASVVTGGKRADRPRLLLRADGGERGEADRRDRPARGLRTGRHRAALHRRGRGHRVGQRRRLRAGGLGVDERRRSCACASPTPCSSGRSG